MQSARPLRGTKHLPGPLTLWQLLKSISSWTICALPISFMAGLQQRWPSEGPGKCKQPLLSVWPSCLPEAAADRVCLQAIAMAATSDEVQAAAALPRELQQLVTTFSSVGAVDGCLALSNLLETDSQAPSEVLLLKVPRCMPANGRPSCCCSLGNLRKECCKIQQLVCSWLH